MYAVALLSVIYLYEAQSVVASPFPSPQWGGSPSSDPVCTEEKTYQNTVADEPKPGPARLVAGERCVAHAAGCSISDGKSYTVTVTVTEGVDLGLDFGEIADGLGASLGLSSSISVATSKAESITTTVNCPSGCTCGVQAIPSIVHVEGTQTTTVKNEIGPDSACVGDGETTAPYSLDLPLLDKGGAKNNQAVITYSACRVAHTFCTTDPSLPLCPPPA